MSWIRIIDNSAGHLYSITAPDHHDSDHTAFDEIFDFWNDADKLFEFFKENVGWLPEGCSIEDAVEQVVREAGQLEQKLYEYADSGIPWSAVFTQLERREYELKLFQKSKTRQGWLRLYAIRLEGGAYMVTGGAIKLWQTMDQHDTTIEQLRRMNHVRDVFRREQIFRLEE